VCYSSLKDKVGCTSLYQYKSHVKTKSPLSLDSTNKYLTCIQSLKQLIPLCHRLPSLSNNYWKNYTSWHVPSLPWTLGLCGLFLVSHMYSVADINTWQLRIISNKSTLYSCVSDVCGKKSALEWSSFWSFHAVSYCTNSRLCKASLLYTQTPSFNEHCVPVSLC